MGLGILPEKSMRLCLSELHSYNPVVMGLKDQLKDIIPERALCSLSDRFDVIGNIAVLSIPEELADYRYVIADAVISRRHNIRTVLNKISRLDGSNRTAHYEIIAGSDTVTVHKEYGFTYRLDISTVFYNPRLVRERKRVTDQVRPGERVLVPFCGVGPFVIPAAAHGAFVVAVDQNPEACRWLVENVTLNGVKDRVTILIGNAFDTSLLPAGAFDHVIIPTPYGMNAIFDVITSRVKPGGLIHFYTFSNRDQSDALAEEFVCRGFKLVVQRRCGNVAPSISRWVYDLLK
jgi:tRNA (guanine37-N1)-methyltransferase